MTKLLAALTDGVEAQPRDKTRFISIRLATAADVRKFSVGKTVESVVEPLDDHTRFVFSDGSALLVVTAGPVGYYAEPALH